MSKLGYLELKRRIWLVLKTFARSNDGNVIVLFTLGIVPLLLCITLAIDMSRASNQKAKFDAALDSVVLFGATKAAEHGSLTTFTDDATATQNYFRALVGNLPTGVTISPLSLTLGHDASDPTLIVAQGSYSASINTMMGSLFKPTINLNGAAKAVVAIPSYVDFYLLLDHSPSMGLAATPDDIAKLVSLTPDHCEFACHTVYSDGSSDPNDYMAIAQRNGVQLRIDKLRQATQSLTQTALAFQLKSGLTHQFRMGVYGFNSSVTVFSTGNVNQHGNGDDNEDGDNGKGPSKDQGLTNDLQNAGAAASGMQLTPYSNDNNYFLTDFVATFKSMEKIVTDPGNGGTPDTPQKYVFFVTDGVQDLPLNNPHGSNNPQYTQYDNTSGWGHAIAPIDPSICDNIKNRGLKIAVLYTPFLATSAGASPLSDHDVALWEGDIPMRLTACASPGLFYTADSAGISDAMARMFQDAVRSARLAQ